MPIAIPSLAWATLTASLFVLYFDSDLRSILRKHWKFLCLMALMALAWRTPYRHQFFYGLEYEDAYVYTVSGRYLSEDVSLHNEDSSPYVTTVCAVGTWKQCRVADTFSGHFLGYPYLIAVFSRILGYRPQLGTYISLFASLLAVMAIFLIGKQIEPNGGVAAKAGVYFYSTTPVFAVQGLGAYAEPTSNLLLLCCLLFFMRTFTPQSQRTAQATAANWLALTCTALFALVVKRENLLLMPTLALSGFVLSTIDPNYSHMRSKPYVAMILITTSLTVAFGLKELQLLSVVRSETGEFGVFPFNWNAFRTMVPLFARSFSTWSWYLGGSLLVAIGIVSWVGRRRLAIFPRALFVFYLLLYSSHIRSYYQAYAGAATTFDAIRYSMNLGGIWAILAGLGLSCLLAVAMRGVLPRHKRISSTALLLGILAYSAWGYVQTGSLKAAMVDNEYRVRLAPAHVAIKAAQELGIPNTYVVTLEPLLIHLLADDAINVVDFRYFDANVAHELQGRSPGVKILYLEQAHYLSEADKKRYTPNFRFLESTTRTVLIVGEGFSLSRLELPPLD